MEIWYNAYVFLQEPSASTKRSVLTGYRHTRFCTTAQRHACKRMHIVLCIRFFQLLQGYSKQTITRLTKRVVNMNKAEIYNYLNEHGISYECTEHPAVYNMEELDALELPYPEWDAKNLFVRDDKKKNFYLITVRGEKRVDLKEFRKAHGLRNLSFASAEDLLAILQLTPGSVSPFGLLNDSEKRVFFYLDSQFVGHKIGVHPNDNTATVWLDTNDLVKLIKEHGTPMEFVELA